MVITPEQALVHLEKFLQRAPILSTELPVAQGSLEVLRQLIAERDALKRQIEDQKPTD